jgi:uncharacterized coiled-coil protein SlyX
LHLHRGCRVSDEARGAMTAPRGVRNGLPGPGGRYVWRGTPAGQLIGELTDRVAEQETEVARLRAEVALLRAEVARLRETVPPPVARPPATPAAEVKQPRPARLPDELVKLREQRRVTGRPLLAAAEKAECRRRHAEEGVNLAYLAREFGVSRNTVSRAIQEQEASG